MTLLHLRDLRVTAGARGQETAILDGVSLALAKGEVLGLVGESGSGKSTLGLAAMGHARPGCRIASGEIGFAGHDLRALPPARLRALQGDRIAYVAQSAAAAFNPGFRLIDQTVETALRHGHLSREAAQARALALFAELGLPDPARIAGSYPHEVSGGQLQRVMTAMAMICEPDLIVFDEPTTALDVTTQVEVLAALRRVVRERGTAALFISHDLAVVAQVSDRLAIMRQGRILEEGTVRQILDAPKDPYTRTLWTIREMDAPVRPATPARLNIERVTAGYPGGGDVISDVALSLGQGRTVAIVGESGSGKSTLARVIAGLLPARQGQITLDDAALPPKLDRRSLAQLRDVQLVHQSPDTSLNPRQRVSELLGHPARHFLGLKGAALKARIDEILRSMELDPALADRFPGELSGGQKQRVALARALLADPKLLICDEVTSALDQVVQGDILRLLARVQAERDLSILFITHDLATVRAIADEVVVMRHGRIVESGATAKILGAPKEDYTRKLIASVPTLDPGWLDQRLALRMDLKVA
ncbi:nickel ABC transporter ATP-binding protein NikE [Paracoccus aminophilus]|uniref:ABC-type dipeptide/oligopeptide/nickel transport system, ATP-binding protein n=1 Tax=Paracoccus aminophilus JCM 7686 TaxID=1367847 RepID=S5Y4K7_PARAH|nr:ABC transporter ATP-binding protein [Paracoccus aminophilus]AGT10670.1 ABC-type dipeptide/oligopeptide/nickel transport system, ATP-binding protein [Paracoccus aminophilus JCM 7686]